MTTELKEFHMSIGAKLAHEAEAAKGRMKKLVGRATGNTRLRIGGHIDHANSATEKAGEKVKDAFKHRPPGPSPRQN
jgi:uncharacterized protein YjbJ (UPF0337 family)